MRCCRCRNRCSALVPTVPTHWPGFGELEHDPAAAPGSGHRRPTGGPSRVHVLVSGLDPAARLGDLGPDMVGRCASTPVQPTVCRDGRGRSANTIRKRFDSGMAAWEDPLCSRPGTGSAPVLSADGFEAPIDWLLAVVTAQKIDLGELSILSVIEAFNHTLEKALDRRSGGSPFPLGQWGSWLGMAATLA
jgi:hypothetical protein